MQSTSAGRKRKDIDFELVTSLRVQNVGWNEIANHPGVSVSRSKLQTWRREVGFTDPRAQLTDENLNEIIARHVEGQPRRGEIQIAAHISTLGFKVPRSQLRASIHHVDPEGVASRSKKPIQRRVYSVAGPHHLWHHDGNHKLIKYGIVIHGCIDGRTRTIIYLSASDSNSSQIVLDLFKDGVRRFQLPLRVRGDKGGENVLVADFMIQHRGVGNSSYIAGLSVHNTRIERLWRDMRNHTIQFYIDLFRYFENDCGMELTNILHIFTLQYLFLPRINEELRQFTEIWNNHKLSTEHNRSPLQLINDLADSTAPTINEGEIDAYGVEENAEDESQETNGDTPLVECLPLECPLLGEQLIEFRNRVNPLSLQHGAQDLANHYFSAMNIINEIFYRNHI